jgi:UDP-N-acetylmuramoyl-L-alanyl-D-glutamate--2,6-diaminopimelate ligase
MSPISFAAAVATITDVIVCHGDMQVLVQSVSYDSRTVRPGTIFVAYQGFHTDGHAYIAHAIAAGASAVIYEDAAYDETIAVPAIRVPNARPALGHVAAALANYPGRAMRVVGVTGTDGKTTTTYLTALTLDVAGRVSGLVGTADFKVAGRLWANATRQSTPEAPEIQQMLVDMRVAGCTHAVLESTSHALSRDWQRLVGCAFDVAVLTNVTSEHLDFHKTVTEYRRAKMQLFEMLGEYVDTPLKSRKTAIVNADDPHHRDFLLAAPLRAERLTYGVHQAADVRARNVVSSMNGLDFDLESHWGNRHVHLNLTGDFNVSNALAALTVAVSDGVPLDDALAVISRVDGVRGRMQRISAGQPFAVLVDYAHTPASFDKVMKLVRPITPGRLIVVFGSAGERDRDKRPQQGQIAASYCDVVYISDEDPRGEDRMTILEEIAVGARAAGRRDGHDLFLIPDRQQAIAAALALAEPRDMVLLLGKGHEGSIIMATGSIPWDEARVARDILAQMGYTASF